MLVCDPTDRTPQPIVIDFVVRLEEFHARVVGQVAHLSGLDADQPMLTGLAADVKRTGDAFDALYQSEIKLARHLAATITRRSARAVSFEVEVRDALANALPLPMPTGADEIEASYILESKEERMSGFATAEAAAKDYILALQVAAASRALLLAAKLRPIVESYQKDIDSLREAEGRIGTDINRGALEQAFKEEGLLP